MLPWAWSLTWQGCYMQELKTLIDKASEKCGSDTALAKRMGVDQPSISQMRAGKRTVTPETAAELADIAGEDPREAMVLAVLVRSKGTRREGVLREILGKALAAGGVGMLPTSYRNESSDSTEKINNSATVVNPLYIVSSSRRLVRGLARWAGNRLRPTGVLPASGSPIPV